MPSSNVQTVYSNGIYHGLPTFPSDPGDHSAIVCGANGISGQAMLKVLSADENRWPHIYSLSRGMYVEGGEDGKGAGVDCAQISHLQLDFTKEPRQIARDIEEYGVHGEYVFWFVYQDNKDEENVAMLRNFLKGCELANLKFKRIILQTGGKHYGVHQGPYKVPAEEDDPRVEVGPNFYYRQEDLLAELAAQDGFDYVIVRPMTIIGAVKGNFLNLAMALGLYLGVTKELGDTPVYNGSLEKYNSVEALSSATMNAYFEEWCALTPSCANEAFNITNGDVSVWARLFPALCAFFHLPLPTFEAQFSAPPPRPASGQFPTVRPLDHTEPGTWELRNSWQQWAHEERTMEAWERLAAREGLQVDAFYRASWAYADRNMALTYNKLESLKKARTWGWLGYVDSTEQVLEVLGQAQDMGILPRYS